MKFWVWQLLIRNFVRNCSRIAVKAVKDWKFALTDEEETVFSQLEIDDLADFSQRPIDLLSPKRV